MNYSLEDQVLALAGVFQAAAIVDQIARHGTWPEAAFECSIQSLLRNDVAHVAEVYGDRFGVAPGLRQLTQLLDRRQDQRHLDTVRYALMLLYLESKLRQRADLTDIIRQRLGDIETRLAGANPASPEGIRAFASLYSDTLSTLPQRVQVKGEPRFLQIEDNADRIRATLLAGIRSAVLWHQTGGRRWKLLFNRRKTLETARQLLG